MTKDASEVRLGKRGNFLHQPNSNCWKVRRLFACCLFCSVFLVGVLLFGFVILGVFFLIWILFSDNNLFICRTEVSSCTYPLIQITFAMSGSHAAVAQKNCAICFVDWDLISLSLGVIEDFTFSDDCIYSNTAAFKKIIIKKVICFTCILHSEVDCPVLEMFFL